MKEIGKIQILVYDTEGSVQKSVNLRYVQFAGIAEGEDDSEKLKLTKAELGEATTEERLIVHKTVDELVDPREILFKNFVDYISSEAAKKNKEGEEE